VSLTSHGGPNIRYRIPRKKGQTVRRSQNVTVECSRPNNTYCRILAYCAPDLCVAACQLGVEAQIRKFCIWQVATPRFWNRVIYKVIMASVPRNGITVPGRFPPRAVSTPDGFHRSQGGYIESSWRNVKVGGVAISS
jgi:hypothetical protein